MIVLGITHPISLNNAACLLVDGRLVAFAEEERFIRFKHAPHTFPKKAIDFCLKTAGIDKSKVDITAIGFARAEPGMILEQDVKSYFQDNSFRQSPDFLRFSTAISLLDKDLLIESYGRRQHFDHHLSHVASACIPSGFSRANFISLDGWGGEHCGLLGWWNGSDKFEIYRSIPFLNSWGVFFEMVTEQIGFRRHSGEGKTMGLAAYGKVDTELLPDWCDEELGLPDNLRYFQYLQEKIKLRKSDQPLDSMHKNLAATLQHYYQRSLVKIAATLHERSGLSDFAMAGGVALNCTANGHLAQQPFVSDLFIQPASHDAGTALGAAILAHREATGAWPEIQFDHAYWGPEYSDEEILKSLQFAKLPFQKVDPSRAAADCLLKDMLVGWFQGRSEIGPRALGHRSILANPTRRQNLNRVNLDVKRRELWRPLAPSVLEEHYHHVFETRIPSPFMLSASQVKPEWAEKVPAVTHVDGSARPQRVSRTTNPEYYDLIAHFHQATSIPLVLNTSFNLDDEPVVESPENAIATFSRSGLDALVIGNFLVLKGG